MQTVFIDATQRPYREIARDARCPLDRRVDIERLADAYSQRDRVVRVYATGLYERPWRKQGARDALYESRAGTATADYQ